MKIAIFIDTIASHLIYKDVCQIALGLKDLGHTVVAITFKQKCTEFPLPIILVKKDIIMNEKFWKENNFDFLLFYSWLSFRYNMILKKIHEYKVKIILKLDSNGHLGYPLIPTYLRGFGYFTGFKDFIDYTIRFFEWTLLLKFISRKKIEQIEYVDYAIIETPDAWTNLVYLLFFYNKYSLISKVTFIINPIEGYHLNKQQDFSKEKIISCIGRWNDRAKNRECIAYVLQNLFNYTQDWTINIIGPGSEYFIKKIRNLPQNIRSKIFIQGEVDREGIFNILSNTKILFMPSRWESFGLTAAEALSCGCSLVGTPNESFRFFSQQGFSGTISSSFNNKSILSTLLMDIYKWETGKYDPNIISEYWYKKFDRKIIAANIIDLLKNEK